MDFMKLDRTRIINVNFSMTNINACNYNNCLDIEIFLRFNCSLSSEVPVCHFKIL